MKIWQIFIAIVSDWKNDKNKKTNTDISPRNNCRTANDFIAFSKLFDEAEVYSNVDLTCPPR